jgi:hypothetical protein
VAQAIEHLLCKHKALSPNPSSLFPKNILLLEMFLKGRCKNKNSKHDHLSPAEITLILLLCIQAKI